MSAPETAAAAAATTAAGPDVQTVRDAAEAAAKTVMDAARSASQTVADATDAAAKAFGQGSDLLGPADGVFSWGGYFQAIALLFLFIGLLWLGLWFLKRRGGIQKLGILTRDLTVENRLALGPKKTLVVVRFLNKRMLLGVTDQRITLLTELSDDDEDSHNTTSATGATGDAGAFRAALTAAADAEDAAEDEDT